MKYKVAVFVTKGKMKGYHYSVDDKIYDNLDDGIEGVSAEWAKIRRTYTDCKGFVVALEEVE